MSDEIKTTEVKECNCFCHSEGFRNFITIALGSFVGVFCALSLFAALHKPPMMVPHHPFARPCHCGHFEDFNKGKHFDKADFHKIKMHKTDRQAPFERENKDND